jgi:small-conductance mechanosensitive channel
MASEILGLGVLTRWLSEVALYLPRLLAAVLIVAFGVLGAKGVGHLVLRTAHSVAIPAAQRLRRAVELAVILASLVVAVEQLGLEIAFLKAFVLIFVAAILGAAALAFGLGSRDIVANVLSAHYLQRVYQVGQTIRAEGVEGRIVRITEIALIVDDGEGEVVIPAQLLIKTQSSLVFKPRAEG